MSPLWYCWPSNLGFSSGTVPSSASPCRLSHSATTPIAHALSTRLVRSLRCFALQFSSCLLLVLHILTNGCVNKCPMGLGVAGVLRHQRLRLSGHSHRQHHVVSLLCHVKSPRLVVGQV